MRVMAIDYGEKKVGIASTDDSGHFALPRFVWPNDAALLDKVLKFKDEEGVEKVIIGESKDFKGKPNPIQIKIDQFRQELEELGVNVSYHPEILTTMESRRLQGNTEMTDASAAALILKSYLDSVYNK